MLGMREAKSKGMMTMREFRQYFGEEQRCWAHWTRLRWPRGFVCPRCGGDSRGYMKAKRVHECRGCGDQGSVTAGTIFHKTRVPLSDWFWAIYRLSQGKKGIWALQLSRELGVSSPTAWRMAHKIRKAMEDREPRTRLRGLVEVDEGFVGGAEEGRGRMGRGRQTQSRVAVAVEHHRAGKPGRSPLPGRMALAVIPDARAESLRAFLRAKVRPGSAVLTDGFCSYRGLTAPGFAHAAIPLRHDRELTRRWFPWVHITLSNLKRFLLGTHHKPQAQHMKRYRAEFQYRLNWRGLAGGMFDHLAQACLDTNTIIYKDLVA